MRKTVAVVAALAVPAALAGAALLALVGALFGASANAADNPCISPIGPVADSGGPVRLPVVGRYTPTSEYGMRVDPDRLYRGQYRMHSGLDLAEQPRPGAVVAVKAGVVKSTADSAGGGHEIIIDHGGGVATRYEHLASRTVTVGERVWAGRQIGVEGATGNVTGPHVHLEVSIDGARVNPRGWLREQGVTVPATGVPGTAPPAAPTDPAGSAPGGPSASPSGNSGVTWPSPSPAPLIPIEPAGQTRPVAAALPARVGAYRGEQVINAGYVVRAGRQMGLDAKTITIAVMTAMGESSLVNVGHGDAAGPDSRGLFQQRDSWGTLEQRMDPTTSAGLFYRALTAVPDYLSLPPTIAAHRTQRNADPYHYAPYWAAAAQMVAAVTADPSLLASLPAGGLVEGCDGGGPGGPAPAGDGSGAAIVAAARRYLGTPYSWGGGDTRGPSLGIYTAPSLDGTHTVGFDCSGLVLYAVHNATGVSLPHAAGAQGHDPRGQTVPRDWSKMRPGDVIAFSEDGSGAAGTFGHVGIYLGGGKMIHAPRPGRAVEVVQLKGVGYYESMAWAIKRYAKSHEAA